MKYITIFLLILLTACSVSHTDHSLSFTRQSFERTADGTCRRPGRVILGLELHYEVVSLKKNKDSVYGQINYYSERLNPKSNKYERLPYDKPLYIYELDNAHCMYRFLYTSGVNGDFVVRLKRPGGVIGFSYYKPDSAAFIVMDAVIINR